MEGDKSTLCIIRYSTYIPRVPSCLLPVMKRYLIIKQRVSHPLLHRGQQGTYYSVGESIWTRGQASTGWV